MTHRERYSGAPQLDIQTSLIVLRKHIGELPDLRMPTREEVEAAAETVFPNLLTNERAKVVEAFIASEEGAAAEADRRAEQS